MIVFSQNMILAIVGRAYDIEAEIADAIKSPSFISSTWHSANDYIYAMIPDNK